MVEEKMEEVRREISEEEGCGVVWCGVVGVEWSGLGGHVMIECE